MIILLLLPVESSATKDSVVQSKGPVYSQLVRFENYGQGGTRLAFVVEEERTREMLQ